MQGRINSLTTIIKFIIFLVIIISTTLLHQPCFPPNFTFDFVFSVEIYFLPFSGNFTLKIRALQRRNFLFFLRPVFFLGRRLKEAFLTRWRRLRERRLLLSKFLFFLLLLAWITSLPSLHPPSLCARSLYIVAAPKSHSIPIVFFICIFFSLWFSSPIPTSSIHNLCRRHLRQVIEDEPVSVQPPEPAPRWDKSLICLTFFSADLTARSIIEFVDSLSR